jgi:hypothetical protein
MTEINPEREQPQPSKDDSLDRALDTALAKYASVEPRSGLEARILFNLRAQAAQAESHTWRRWGWAFAFAVVAVGTLLAWKSVRPSHPVVAHHLAETTKNPDRSARPVVSSNEGNLPSAPTVKPAVRVSMRRHLVAEKANPKLDVFPSPQPLSDQELALARYVQNFPRDAKLVARAQEASEREVLAKMEALANESAESN